MTSKNDKRGLKGKEKQVKQFLRNVRQTNKQDAGMSHDDDSSIYKLGKRKWSQLIVFVPFHRIYQDQ